ncbi:MAG: hypothetical protein JSV31_09460 [Desulfobacterales bacterium]|nr:MAG: hypothetical protein JSV31_09460 [Desulfobacterales bacterium]
MKIDRLSVGLSSLWNALINRNLAQAYLNLFIIFESLLSTRGFEITHMLSERAALLIEKKADRRVQVYKDMKKLYNLRSKIVHGKTVSKKGPITWESFVVSTKFTNVPISNLKHLFDLSFRLIAYSAQSDHLNRNIVTRSSRGL